MTPEVSLFDALEDTDWEVACFGLDSGLEKFALLLAMGFPGLGRSIVVDDRALLRIRLLDATVEGECDSEIFLFIAGKALQLALSNSAMLTETNRNLKFRKCRESTKPSSTDI